MGLLTAGVLGLFRAEVALARRAIGEAGTDAPRADGVHGKEHGGEPIRFAMLGDSSAVGFGVEHAAPDARRDAGARAWPSARAARCT